MVAFGGVFDGDGHTISGLKIDNSAQYQALFGYVKGGTIKNLTVEGSVTTATTSSAYAAGIVAYGNPVTMETCMNRVTVTVTQKGYAGRRRSVCKYGQHNYGLHQPGEYLRRGRISWRYCRNGQRRDHYKLHK